MDMIMTAVINYGLVETFNEPVRFHGDTDPGGLIKSGSYARAERQLHVPHNSLHYMNTSFADLHKEG